MSSHDATQDEETPLLSDERIEPSREHPSTYETHSPRVIVLLLFTIIFILSFGGYLMMIPGVRIYEDILCHQYYERLHQEGGYIGLEKDIDESLCKGDEVQNQLNILLAGVHFLSAVPGLLTAIPYGLLADRIGRKPVFAMMMVGIILAGFWNLTVMKFWRVLPLRLIWLSPLFMLIGGGEVTASMVVFAIGSDITTEANRANVFLFVACGGLLGQMIAPSVASALMIRVSPWIPIFLGLGTIILGTLLFMFVPETLHLRDIPTLTLNSSSDETPKMDDSTFFTALKSQVLSSLNQIYAAATILNSLPIIFLLITFITEPLTQQSIDLYVRYISQRFSWKLSEAGFLLTLRAFVNMILLLVIIPLLTYYLIRKLKYTPKEKDLSLARLSAIMFVLGSLLIASAPSIGITITGLSVWTLGTGFTAFTRSLVTSLVVKQHVARLYAAIAVFETAGALATGPLLMSLYSLGLKMKGAWIGLPFFIIAGISFVAGLGVWCFGLLSRNSQEGMSYGDETEILVGDTLQLGSAQVRS